MTPTLSSAEVAVTLGATKRWVDDLARSGQIAYVLGPRRTVRFTPEQVEALIAFRTRTPADPTPSRSRARRTA